MLRYLLLAICLISTLKAYSFEDVLTYVNIDTYKIYNNKAGNAYFKINRLKVSATENQ
jgi:hypothetical protein